MIKRFIDEDFLRDLKEFHSSRLERVAVSSNKNTEYINAINKLEKLKDLLPEIYRKNIDETENAILAAEDLESYMSYQQGFKDGVKAILTVLI